MGSVPFTISKWGLSHLPFEEVEVVVVSDEARLAIVPALNDMYGKSGNLQTLATGHGSSRNSSSMPPTTHSTGNG